MELTVIAATALIIMCLLGFLIIYVLSLVIELRDANVAMDEDLTAVERWLESQEEMLHDLHGHPGDHAWGGAAMNLRMSDAIEQLRAELVAHLADETFHAWDGHDEDTRRAHAEAVRVGEFPTVDALMCSVEDLISGMAQRFLAMQQIHAADHLREAQIVEGLKRGPGRGDPR